MSYKVKIQKRAAKFLEKIPRKDALKILQVIDALSQDPRPRWIEKIKGVKTDLFRTSWGNYRIIYTIEDDILIVTVFDINARKDVYKKL